MSFSEDELDRMAEVLQAQTTSFAALVHIARLDPKCDLVGADLRNIDVGDDDLTGFNFAEADVRGAKLRHARGLVPEMFDGVIDDDATQWPPGLRDAIRKRTVTRPGWASGFGRDQFGVFADFTLPGTDITQRLRWIPPGRFLMGSPSGEEGRFDNEGPQHEVTLAAGFWLFDTPCTQALWEAVMGGNPSEFKSPTRPMERVSFEDAEAFLRKLNVRVPDLDLALPSEAQWEYACRAGTDTATWAGDLSIDEHGMAPLLDAIAWYNRNSGNGTQPVAKKAANPWGLYDMLGNVSEWCVDDWGISYAGAPTNGSVWHKAHYWAPRIVRGGSWLGDARSVRAAARNGVAPTYRGDDLGFRCARVQVTSAASEAECRVGRSKRRERSEQAATTSPERGVARPRSRKRK